MVLPLPSLAGPGPSLLPPYSNSGPALHFLLPLIPSSPGPPPSLIASVTRPLSSVPCSASGTSSTSTSVSTINSRPMALWTTLIVVQLR